MHLSYILIPLVLSHAQGHRVADKNQNRAQQALQAALALPAEPSPDHAAGNVIYGAAPVAVPDAADTAAPSAAYPSPQSSSQSSAAAAAEAVAAITANRTESSFSWSGLALPLMVIGGLGGMAVIIGRKRARTSKLIQILETTSLGPKRSLIVARVAGNTLLLSTSEVGVQLLTPIRENAELQAAADRAAAGVDLTDQPNHHRNLGQASLLARLLKREEPAAKSPEFDELLSESLEDKELRRKLESGYAGRVA